MIEFHCGTCGRNMHLPDDATGKTGKCPQCQTPFRVPAAPELRPAPMAPPAPAVLATPVEPEAPTPAPWPALPRRRQGFPALGVIAAALRIIGVVNGLGCTAAVVLLGYGLVTPSQRGGAAAGQVFGAFTAMLAYGAISTVALLGAAELIKLLWCMYDALCDVRDRLPLPANREQPRAPTA